MRILRWFLWMALASSLVTPVAAGGEGGRLAGAGGEPRRPSQLVVIRNTVLAPVGGACGGFALPVDRLVVPADTVLTIPEGQVLVLTGLDYVTNPTAAQPFELILATPQGPASVFLTTPVVPPNLTSEWTVSARFPGIPVKPGVTVCVPATPDSVTSARVYGFLAPDE